MKQYAIIKNINIEDILNPFITWDFVIDNSGDIFKNEVTSSINEHVFENKFIGVLLDGRDLNAIFEFIGVKVTITYKAGDILEDLGDYSVKVTDSDEIKQIMEKL